MARAKKQRRRQRAAASQRPAPQVVESKPRRWWARLGTVLSAGATIVSLVLGAIVLPPTFVFSSEPLLDPKDPFSALFIITNNGYMPAYTIATSCHLHFVDYQRAGRVGPFTTFATGDSATILRGSDRIGIRCMDAKVVQGDDIVGADMSVCVNYRLPLIGWRKAARGRFVTDSLSKNPLRWVQRPVKEEPFLSLRYDPEKKTINYGPFNC